MITNFDRVVSPAFAGGMACDYQHSKGNMKKHLVQNT